jgi:hypothetical protein
LLYPKDTKDPEFKAQTHCIKAVTVLPFISAGVVQVVPGVVVVCKANPLMDAAPVVMNVGI